MTASVFDVALYILESQGRMTHMKLQKLCYYSQAWHLVWEAVPLFHEKIEAWANGPVIPALYDVLKGEFEVDADLLRSKLGPPSLPAKEIEYEI